MSPSSLIMCQSQREKHNFTTGRSVITLINLSLTDSEETTFVIADMMQYDI